MSLGKFLTLNFIFAVLLGGCASSPPITPFDSEWEFIMSPTDGKQKACLDEDAVKRLKELLIRARAKE